MNYVYLLQQLFAIIYYVLVIDVSEHIRSQYIGIRRGSCFFEKVPFHRQKEKVKFISWTFELSPPLQGYCNEDLIRI
jgi:hypothetical protein